MSEERMNEEEYVVMTRLKQCVKQKTSIAYTLSSFRWSTIVSEVLLGTRAWLLN